MDNETRVGFQYAIPLPTKFLENRRTYLAGEYNRLLSKIGAYDATDLKHIVGLSIVHVQLAQVIEALGERSEEVQK